MTTGHTFSTGTLAGKYLRKSGQIHCCMIFFVFFLNIFFQIVLYVNIKNKFKNNIILNKNILKNKRYYKTEHKS